MTYRGRELSILLATYLSLRQGESVSGCKLEEGSNLSTHIFTLTCSHKHTRWLSLSLVSLSFQDCDTHAHTRAPHLQVQGDRSQYLTELSREGRKEERKREREREREGKSKSVFLSCALALEIPGNVELGLEGS